MTNFEPTSRCAMRPSGETLDFVSPGMSSVVGRAREPVVEPESCRRGLIKGLLGAVVAGVSVKAVPILPLRCGVREFGAGCLGREVVSEMKSDSSGDRLPSETDALEEGGLRWLEMAVFAIEEC